MTAPVQTDCLAASEVAAFLGKRPDPDARQRVIAHLAACDACHGIIVEILNIRSDADGPPRRTFRSARRRVIAAGMLAGAIIVLAFAQGGHRRAFDAETPLAALVEATESIPHRIVEGRLSGCFGYKPFRETLRSSSATDERWRTRLEHAAAAVESESGTGHAAGVAALLKRDYDRAVDVLEGAARAEPRNAAVLSDLSAAYRSRAVARSYAPDHMAALDVAERAWYVAKTPEIAWNRAIAISAFSVAAPARRAWDDFLRVDIDPQWHSEARRRQSAFDQRSEADQWQRIEARLLQADSLTEALRADVRRFRAQALRSFEDTFVTQWSDAQLHGRSAQAVRIRALAEAIATALDEPEDRFAADAIAAIEAACSVDRNCDALARAHARYAEGLHLLRNGDVRAATTAFGDSAATFERLRSPYVFLARFRHGACMLYSNRFAAAREAGQALITALDQRPYRTLHAHIGRLVGLAELHEARPEESIAHYRAARDRCIVARDLTTLGSVELLLADAFEYAGDREAAMGHRLASLDAMRRSGDTKQLALALFEAGTSASAQGYTDAADFLLAESVRQAVTRREFVVAALASMWRSMLASRRDDLAEAGEQARAAAMYSAQVTDPAQRALVDANEKQLALSSDERVGAAENLTEAIDFFDRAGNRAWLPQLLRQRALVHDRGGERAAAEADLRRSIASAEQILHGATPAAMRDGFAAEIRANYEHLIRLLLDRGASREALAVAERARLIGGGEQTDDKVLRATRRMQPNTVAAVLEVQPGALVVWLATRDRARVTRWHVAPESLRDAVTRLGDSPSESTRELLYDLLVREWIAEVPRGSRLVILPPPLLESVPFGALTDRESGRAVIDDYVVSVARNLQGLRKRPTTVAASDTALIVGDPAYRTLDPLPASRREARVIARHYIEPTVLMGTDATATNVLARISEAVILHFGGHAVVNELTPELSSVMLAPDGSGDDTRIYVRQLLQRHLRMKLVVLSACSTARNRSGTARGSLTIARAFLDGGAEAVVGTQWAVPDAAAAAFSQALHEALARGEDVARATRSAQLHLRARRPEDPAWAAFYVLHGNGSKGEGPDA